ncbi:MAG: class I SAM-dependent methyltransferase [Anaerolineaceae bacterium]|nr:class I SAM-dependent methyltransferase [Anaerolineaceae bacterium]
MFQELNKINKKPLPFECYTSDLLWNDEHISKHMLEAHLDANIEAASRKKEFIDRSVDWIASHFAISNSYKICDFGCGPGLYTTQFAQRGADVMGIDLSERSIHFAQGAARKMNLNIDYVLQDYLQFSTEKQFDLITMIYRDFSALSPEQRKTLLGTFRRLLSDDGAVLLDVDSMVHYIKASDDRSYNYLPHSGFWSPYPHYVFVNIHKYEEEKVVCTKYTILEGARTREVFIWNQCFNLQMLKEEFSDNGLQIVEYYSDVAGTPFRDDSPEWAIVARKST